ncbi:hypothetical protein L1286_23725, partial [Pseudoalteromonas sp. SMS1]|uniref:DUF6531 domain-containing protein n=1 Tax=Pseudoalteromonas sp. SMS1 TaxID=2908894 RepID=UPI001F3B9EE0
MFVNAATGNLVIQGQDESIAGLGQGLGMVRTYNSQGGFDGDNNDQWRLGFVSSWQVSAGSLHTAGSNIELVRADGFVQTFTYNVNAKKYVSMQGSDAHDVLTVNADGTAVLQTDGNKGVKHHFNADKTLSAITNQYDQGITLSYTGGKVTSITTKTETGTETTTLTYNAAGLLASVKTAAD